MTPRSLLWSTDIDVLAIDRCVERRESYLLVRSPRNPGFYWGNFLLFDVAPAVGDGARWESAFEGEFSGDPAVRHRAFAWDLTDRALGAVASEFLDRGYELEERVGLVAAPSELRPHPRENAGVSVRTLDPSEAALWQQVVELQVAGRPASFSEESFRDFVGRRLDELRELFIDSRGAWWVALIGDEVAGSCGLVVTDGRARFQAVDTAEAHRRRGICSRLVVETARRTDAEHFVIAADPDYHALGLYESLGFRRREHVCGVFRRPPAD